MTAAPAGTLPALPIAVRPRGQARGHGRWHRRSRREKADRIVVRLRLRRAGRGDPPHGRDDRGKLVDGSDPVLDVDKLPGHLPASPAACRRAARKFADLFGERLRPFSSISPLAAPCLDRLGWPASSLAATPRARIFGISDAGTSSNAPPRAPQSSATSIAIRRVANRGCVQQQARIRSPRAIRACGPACGDAAEAGEHLQLQELRVVEPQRARPPRAAPAPGSCRRPG